MKFNETSFEEYLIANSNVNLHPKQTKINNSLPKKIENFKNIILYGPSGVGKYTQMLLIVKRYSPSQLKYEKKLNVVYNKNTFFFKISDIHYEIDLSTIGCHSKILWNDIYSQIVDITLLRKDKSGIIVCKNFHEIHIELLESFYSYMQTMLNITINLKFIIITEAISFIPDNIVNSCRIIHISRPSRIQYNKCVNNKLKPQTVLNEISNIKHIHSNITKHTQPYEVISNSIYTTIINRSIFSYTLLREQLYDILIYNLNVEQVILFILDKLISEKRISKEQLIIVCSNVYKFCKNYNNNYRPIYHLEKLVISLIQIVHNIV
jgi:hypothetical protein